MSWLFGQAIHAAFVVNDIDAEIARMLAMGLGPVYVMRNIRPNARFRGDRHDPLITAAFLYSGHLQLEFLQQHDDTPSSYREFLERQPAGGLNHLAYYCDDFGSALARAAEAGRNYDVVQEYVWPDGTPYEIYLEPSGEDNPLLVQLIRPGVVDRLFDRMKQEAASWDGKDPIRDAMAMMAAERTRR